MRTAVRIFLCVSLVILQMGGCVQDKINGKLLRPFSQYETLPEDWGVAVEPVSLRSGDVRLHGWFISGGEGIREAVLVCGGSKGNKASYIPLAKIFQEAGYSVLLFDYRGYGASEGTADFYEAVEDARAGLEYLKRRPDINPDRIAVFGISMGALAVLGLSPDPSIRAFILEAVPNFREATNRRADWVTSVVATMSIPQVLDPYLTALQVGDRPVLFVHGTNDKITPLNEMFPVQERSGDKNAVFIVPGAGHSPEVAIAERHTYRRMIAQFLKSNLSGTGDALWFRATVTEKSTEPSKTLVMKSVSETEIRLRRFGPGKNEPSRLRARVVVDTGESTPSVEEFDLEYVPGQREYRVTVHGHPVGIGVTQTGSEEALDVLLVWQLARYRMLEGMLDRAGATPAGLVEMERELEGLSRPEVDEEVRKRVSALWLKLAGQHRTLKDLAAAERCYRRVFDFLPKDPATYHEMGGEGRWFFGFPTSIAVDARTALEEIVQKTEGGLERLPENPYEEWSRDRAEKLRLRTESDRSWLETQP